MGMCVCEREIEREVERDRERYIYREKERDRKRESSKSEFSSVVYVEKQTCDPRVGKCQVITCENTPEIHQHTIQQP